MKTRGRRLSGYSMRRPVAAAVVLAACGLAMGREGLDTQGSALKTLEYIYPGIGIHVDQDRVHMIYGLPMGGGVTPEHSAEQWIIQYGAALGAAGSVLQETWNADFSNPANAQFTVFTYQQYIGGVPVEHGIAKILVLHNATNSVVYAAGTLAAAPAGGFPAPKVTGEYAQAVVQATASNPKMTQWSKPELVVYQGNGDWTDPVLAWKFVGESPSLADQLRITYFVDAATGAVAGARDEVVSDVGGVVRGNATPGLLPDTASNPTTLTGLPEIKVTGTPLGGTVFTDRSGNYNLTVPVLFSTTAATGVGAGNGFGGRWVSVVPTGLTPLNASGGSISPGTVNLTLNGSPSAATNAEVNAFIATDAIHNYFRDRSGTFNAIDLQLPANTGVAGTCNAFFNGSSINFFNAGGGCVNSAYSTVVAHEYGHFIVNRLGLAQNAFGEGFGDTVAMLSYNTPIVAADFFGPGSPIRNPPAANVQYPCSNEIHFCGQVIAGCWWNIRNSGLGLAATQQLQVSWALITTGGPDSSNSAGPGTLVEVLVTDDNDGNIYNGTPHDNNICPSFASHNILTPACGSGSAPANNNCASAALITNGSTPFTTVLATTDGPSEPGCGFCCNDPQISNDIWYTYTATSTGTVTVSLCNSTYDTKLAVYNGAGCPSTGSAIACNDDACGTSGLRSQLTFNSVVGSQYKIRVGGYVGQTGTGTIVITPHPGNDNCANAFVIGDGTTAFGTEGATTDGPAVSCAGFNDPQVNQDVWYTYTATFTGPCNVSLCSGTNYDSKLAVYDGAACPGAAGSELVCDDDACAFAGASALTFNAVYGHQYKIRVGGYQGSFGTGLITISPGNDDCGNAFPISDGTTPFTTGGTTTDGPIACAPLGKDAWFDYTASETGTVTVSTCGTDFDTVLVVYDSFACPPGAVVGCNDDFCGTTPPRQSQLSFPSTVGHHYKIRVAGYDYGSGDIRSGAGVINISSTPANDSCANALPLSNGITPFGNLGATTDGPAACAPLGRDVWYNYTASCTGSATITLCGSGFDTVLSVYNGFGCPAGTVVACNDDFCGFAAPSQVTFNTVAGGQYKVRISGYDYGNGDIRTGTGIITASCIGNCYPNCDASTVNPCLNVNDFVCFLNRFAASDPYANCDASTQPPTLNVNDFVCFLNRFAAGCSGC